MLLTNWKEIASHLHCSVRSAQRWERKGLPINRPFSGRRSHVVAESEILDSWMRDAVFWRSEDFEVLDHIQRSRQLRGQMSVARQTLRDSIELLRRNRAAVYARIEQLHKTHINREKPSREIA